MPTHEKSPAHTPTPWICSHSQNPDVYRNEEHWLIVSHPSESTAQAVADVETGPGPKTSRANAEFIVRACNAHDDLLAACAILEGILWGIVRDKRRARAFERHEGFHPQLIAERVSDAILKAHGNAA